MKNKAKLLSLTDENFSQHVLENVQPVLVKFVANWSGPCHIMNPVIEELAIEFSHKIRFYTLDVEKYPTVKMKYDVRVIPTLLVFTNGGIIDQATGVVSKTELVDKLNALLEIKR